MLADPPIFAKIPPQSHSRALLVSSSSGSSGPAEATALITGASTGLSIAPPWPAASADGIATFNRSGSLKDFMTSSYVADPKNYLFRLTRVMANGTGLVPFTEKNRQVLT